MNWIIMSKYVFTMLVGMLIMKLVDLASESRKTGKFQDMLSKQAEFYDILIQWHKIRQKGKSVADFFRENGYSTVAIYGMKEIGQLLLEELSKTEIRVNYCIDRNADSFDLSVRVITPDGVLDKVDVVVITAVHAYEEIEPDLRDKLGCEIVSVEDVVYFE